MPILQVSIAPLLHPKSEKKDTECGRLLRDAFEILFSHVCVIYLVSQKTRLEAYSICIIWDSTCTRSSSARSRVGRLGFRCLSCGFGVLRWAGLPVRWTQDGIVWCVSPKADAGENTVLGAPQRRHRSWGGRGLGGSE